MKKKIYILDDDLSVIQLLREYLELAGFSVFSQSNPRIALEEIEILKPNVLICDLNMPEITGFDVLKHLKTKEDLKDIYVILLTSFDRIDFKIKGLEIGADDYITKPFHKSEVLARIRSALRRIDRESEDEINGDLSRLSLVDILQLFEINRKSGLIYIPHLNAKITISEGYISKLAYKSFDIKEGLLRLLLTNKGKFRIKFSESISDALGIKIGDILLDLLSKLDELKPVLGDNIDLDSVIKDESKFLLSKLGYDCDGEKVRDIMVKSTKDLNFVSKLINEAYNQVKIKVEVSHG